MPGTNVRVRGLKQYRHPKTGILYTYHRATGTRILAQLGTPEFFAEYAALETQVKAAQEEAAKPGTLGALVLSYKETDAWGDLAKRTKQDYEKVFAFLAPLNKAPLQAFTTPRIVELRDKWRQERGRRFVNYCLTVLTLLMGRAIELGLARENAAEKVKRIKRDRSAAPMNRPWSEAERWAVWQRTGLPRYQHLRLPLAIGMYLGMREADMIALPRTAIKNGRIAIETKKRRIWIDLPVNSDLGEAVKFAHTHQAITLCANSRGRPWSQDGFRTSFFKMIKELERERAIEPGLTYHGLRHTVAALLAEHPGVSHDDIAAVLGQKSSKVAAHYAERADRKRRASATISKLQPLNQSKK